MNLNAKRIMKTEINAAELALLLDIPVHEARGKINYCLLQPSEDKNPSCSIKLFKEKQKLDLEPYLYDTWNNFMKRSQSRGWVLEYPRKKIWHGTDKPFPKKVSLPRALSSMISPEVKEEIRLAWIAKWQPRLKEEIEFKP